MLSPDLKDFTAHLEIMGKAKEAQQEQTEKGVNVVKLDLKND